MHLTDEERRMLAGEEGEAVRLSMQILTRLGDAYGAERLTPVSSVHAGCAYPNMSVAVEMMERFAALGGRFRVLPTVNPVMTPGNFDRFPDCREPEELKKAATRQINAILEMGAIPSWSCTPYMQGNLPRAGECVVWVESSAIVFANSVLGARSNRNTIPVDIAAAIAGRAPEDGLLLDENRAGDALVRLEFMPESMFNYNTLGFIIGKKCAGKIPVIEGLPRWTTANQLKVMGAAAATKGGIALYHAVGITPEALTREQAFRGRTPEFESVIQERDMRAGIEDLNTHKGGRIDAVLVGCPHPSVSEIGELAGLLKGKTIREDTRFCLFASADAIALARQMGFVKIMEDSGVRLFEGGCILTHPIRAWGWKNVATNSGKYACTLPSDPYYLNVLYTDTRGCVEAATAR